MSNTTRYWNSPHNRFRLNLDKYPNTFAFTTNGIPKQWKEFNPHLYRHEPKSFRTEQHRKVRHQNKILLSKGKHPDKVIEHTQGWNSN